LKGQGKEKGNEIPWRTKDAVVPKAALETGLSGEKVSAGGPGARGEVKNLRQRHHKKASAPYLSQKKSNKKDKIRQA